MPNLEVLQNVIDEEMCYAKIRIIKRVMDLEFSRWPTKKLPENENYRHTLEMFLLGDTIAEIARKLDVSQAAVKKYLDWLRKEGYLDVTNEPLSDKEKKVYELLKQGKSIRKAAEELNCSTTNIVYRRNAALAKGAIL